MREEEIKEVIEYFEGALKNVDEFLLRGISCKIMVKQKARLELVIPILRAELSRQENAPLTWEELVSMTRKTVYIVDRTDDEKSGWAIVGKQYIKIGLEFVTLCENLAFRRELKELYGQTWLAYRYEPKGEPPCTQD